MEAIGLTKSYHRQIPALQDVSLTLRPGEAAGIVGSNGSGKSTLLALLAQAIRPDSGQILEDGRSILGDRAFLRRNVGYVPQTDALVEELTVGQQLRYWQRLTGRPAAEDRDLHALLDLEPLLRMPISRLSGGMKKRVSFALALAGQPRYLFMDEAFSALDQGYRQRLLPWLTAHLEHGGALLWCSHDPAEIQLLCSRVLTLAHGRLTSETGR